jgi:hypothetical protein
MIEIAFRRGLSEVVASPRVATGEQQKTGKRPKHARQSGLDMIFIFPGPRQQFIEAVDGMPVDHAREHIAQVGVGFDAVEFAGLCRPPNYAERVRYGASLSRWRRRSRARQPHSIRHSLVVQSASRKASRRSFGWKRVRLPRSYGLSFARAASLRARWACRYVCVVSTDS